MRFVVTPAPFGPKTLVDQESPGWEVGASLAYPVMGSSMVAAPEWTGERALKNQQPLLKAAASVGRSAKAPEFLGVAPR